jgi:ribose 5-phosphate isomerase B
MEMTANKTPVIVGCDHAAYAMKEKIKSFLIECGIDVTDVGAFDERSVGYSDFGILVASSVSKKRFDRGILICGTGIGMSIVANKFPKVRAALCGDLFSAIMSRRHNDANILVLGGRVIGDVLALEIVKTWLETPFDGGRHQQRLDKIDEIDLSELHTKDLKNGY